MDNCTRGDKPAGWRGEVTVALPMKAWDFLDLGQRLSRAGQQARGITFRLLRMSENLNALEAADQALIAGLEADGWQVTTVQRTRR